MFVAPMKAAAIEQLPTDTDRWIMQPKLDGWRVIAGVSDRGTAWLETSSGSRIETVPYITDALMMAFPPNTILDGEILDEHALVERSWNRTQTILSRNAVHRPTADDPPLTFVAFDCLISVEQDLRPDSLADRLKELTGLFADAKRIYPDFVSVEAAGDGPWAPLRLLEVLPCKQELLDELLAQGYEGVVVKDVRTRYVPGGRSGEWRKLKPDHEIEAVCTGTYEPTAGSKYDGNSVGGITFRVEHPDGKVYNGRCAGMDDRLRADLYEHPERYEGRVVEITHKGVGKDGALRHPQLKRFRDPADKTQATSDMTVDEYVEHIQGATPVDATTNVTARVGTPDPLAALAAQLATGAAKPATAAKRRATARADIVEHGSGVRGRRVMRNYRAMKDKLYSVYLELKAGPGHDAYDRCVQRGSGDPRADLAECERLLRERGEL